MAFQPGNRSAKIELQRERPLVGGSRADLPPEGQSADHEKRSRGWTDDTHGLGIALVGALAGLAALFALPEVLLPICAVAAAVAAFQALLQRSAIGLSAALLAGALSAFGFATHPVAWSSTVNLISLGRDQSDYHYSLGHSAGGGASSGVLTPGSEDALEEATAEATRAETECRHRHEIGELKTYEAAAQCANGQIIPAYRNAGYRYMDLIKSYAAKRVEVAQAVDSGKLTETQAAILLAQFFSGLVDEEHQRDHGGK